MKKLSHNLLIVGAGAHVPYKMPTGAELKDFFKLMLQADSQKSSFEYKVKFKISKIITAMGMAAHTSLKYEEATILVNMFLSRFLGSAAETIDQYLSKRTKGHENLEVNDWIKLGKVILAVSIHEYEKKLPFGCHKEDWVEYLIRNYIKDDINLFFNNPPSIITFNYDRYLEHRIYNSLVDLCELSEVVAKSYVDNMKIIHVYGDIGDYTKWESDDDLSFFENASKRIRIINEERSPTPNEMLKSIAEKVENATKIYFLGFGFDEINTKLIFPSLSEEYTKYRNFNSTSVSLTFREAIKISEKYNIQPFRFKHSEITEVTCLNLLKEIAPLEDAVTKTIRAGNID